MYPLPVNSGLKLPWDLWRKKARVRRAFWSGVVAVGSVICFFK